MEAFTQGLKQKPRGSVTDAEQSVCGGHLSRIQGRGRVWTAHEWGEMPWVSESNPTKHVNDKAGSKRGHRAQEVTYTLLSFRSVL